MANKILSYVIEVKDRASAQLSGLASRFRELVAGAGRAGGTLATLGGIVAKLGGWFMAAQIAAQAFGLAFRGIAASIRETIAYEKDVYRLARALGSVSAANKAMAGIKGSASARDFGRDEATGAAVQLQNAGAGLLINPEALDVIAAAALKADTSLRQVTESVTDVWGALASGNAQAFDAAVRSMGDMGVITPVVAAELIKLRESGASAGEIFATLYGHLEKNKQAMDALGSGSERVQKEIASLKADIAQNIDNLFDPLADAFDWVWKKILEGIKWLTEKPHRLLFTIPGLQPMATLIDKVDAALEKWRGKGEEKAPTDIKEAAAAELNKQVAAAAGGAGAKSQAAAAAEAQKDEARAQRDLDATRRRHFARTASVDDRIADATRRADDANARSIDPKANAAQRMDAEAEALEIELELIELRKEQKRLLDEQNKAEKQIADTIARGRQEADQRAFEKMTPQQQVAALEKQQADLQKNMPGMDAKQRADAFVEYQRIETRKQNIKDREAEAVNRAVKDNNRRVFDRNWERATDEQKSAWLAKQTDAAKSALAVEKDPLKREQLRGRLLDLADKADALEKARTSAREGLADKAQAAREGLAGMGLARSAGVDLGISQRFDWMGAVSKGQSPDEQIAANTEEMKKYLKVIAEAEGVT